MEEKEGNEIKEKKGGNVEGWKEKIMYGTPYHVSHGHELNKCMKKKNLKKNNRENISYEKGDTKGEWEEKKEME